MLEEYSRYRNWSNQSAQKRQSSPASSGALSYCLPFRCYRSHDLCSIPSTIEVSGPDSNAHKSACVRLAKVICGVGASFVTLGQAHLSRRSTSVFPRGRAGRPKPTNPDPARLGPPRWVWANSRSYIVLCHEGPGEFCVGDERTCFKLRRLHRRIWSRRTAWACRLFRR